MYRQGLHRRGPLGKQPSKERRQSSGKAMAVEEVEDGNGAAAAAAARVGAESEGASRRRRRKEKKKRRRRERERRGAEHAAAGGLQELSGRGHGPGPGRAGAAGGGAYVAAQAPGPPLLHAAAPENRGRAAEMMGQQMQGLRAAAPAAVRTLLPFANDRPMLQGVGRGCRAAGLGQGAAPLPGRLPAPGSARSPVQPAPASLPRRFCWMRADGSEQTPGA
jgi:hypothetical protein